MPDDDTLRINDRISIPREALRFTFARSSGPGGQNVNKVNTKATLFWRPEPAEEMPEPVVQRFRARFANRINKRGELVLSSERFRRQEQNVADCLMRLREMLLSVAAAPVKRKKTQTPRGVIERRLKEKRIRSQKKQLRQRPGEE